jgi:hypothetical protein
MVFPVMDKGKKDKDHWPAIREKLVEIGTKIYSKIKDSDI